MSSRVFTPVAELLEGRLDSYHPPRIPGLVPGSADSELVRARPVIVPLFDMTQPALERAISTLARRVVVDPTFCPVIFTSLDLFSIARRHGWVVEHVMDESSWRRLSDRDWTTHVLSRFDAVLAAFGAEEVFAPDLNGRFWRPNDLAQLADLGGAVEDLHDDRRVHGWRAWSSFVLDREYSRITVETNSRSAVEVSMSRSSVPLTFVEITDSRSQEDHGWSERARKRGWSTVTIVSIEGMRDLDVALASLIRHAVPSLATIVSHPTSVAPPAGFDFTLQGDNEEGAVLSSPIGSARLKTVGIDGLLAKLEDLVVR